MEIFFYVLSGVISGVIAGMGMGGGTLLIPILTIFLSINQKSAQGINLLAFVPMAIIALIVHFKNKLVKINSGIALIIPGVLFAVLGAVLANYISNKILKIFFGLFLLLIGVYQLIQIIVVLNKKVKGSKGLSYYYLTNYYAIK